MKISEVRLGTISIPLKRPFKTALRTTNSADDVVVQLITDTGLIGWGSAAPTLAITGESQVSILYVIESIFKPRLIGRSVEDIYDIMQMLNRTVARNTSARAALDMALYDLAARTKKLPLASFLGAKKNILETDITVSVGSIDDMVSEALAHVKQGYSSLKVKVGTDANLDSQRIKEIRNAVGTKIKIRVDANQGWDVETAIRTICLFESSGFDIEFVEQPVKSFDFPGMVKIKKSVQTKLVADESVFSEDDVERILSMGGADIINVKLMKSGGIFNALRICNIAKKYNADCMMSCMLESKIGITAAAAFAASIEQIKYVDLDAASLQACDPFTGGVEFQSNKIFIPDSLGLGISSVAGLCPRENIC